MKKTLRKKILAVALAVFVAFMCAPVAGIWADDAIHVTTGEELDAAIKVLQAAVDNDEFTALARKVIVLDNDIDAIASATYGNRTATNENAPKKLLIDGQGYTINGHGVQNTALRFQSAANRTDLIFRNINFDSLDSNISYGGGALGIFHGTVLIENCTFTNNVAERGDGGAVLIDGNGGEVTIKNSTFYNNSTLVGDGGAIASAAAGYLINSTVTGNTATRLGGGLAQNNATNQLAVVNSIIAGNAATKTVITASVPNEPIASTFANAYDDITVDAGLPIRWTINVGDTLPLSAASFTLPAAAGGGAVNLSVNNVVDFTINTPGVYSYSNAANTYTGTITVLPIAEDVSGLAEGKDLGHNLFGSVSRYFSVRNNVLTVLPTVKAADSALVTDLSAVVAAGAPGANGGLTKTIALVAGSPAINAALSAKAPKVDQRGFLRVGAPDIGAYEYGADQVPSDTNAVVLTADADNVGLGEYIRFTLSGQLKEADDVNVIEAVLDYDKEVFTAIATIQGADGYDVASSWIDTEKGKISLVLGVKNEATIIHDSLADLVKIRLAVKPDETPTAASLTVVSFRAYSRGELLSTEITAASAETTINGASNPNQGDVNGDNIVDAADLSLALYYFGATTDDADWNVTGAADVNGDGIVDIADIMIIVNAIHASL
jgi:hypothetical protein